MVRAQELWHAIIEAQVETGTPYMLFKDACNRKSNHQHLGTIQSSNLCTEVIEYSSPDEVRCSQLMAGPSPSVSIFQHNTRALYHLNTRRSPFATWLRSLSTSS